MKSELIQAIKQIAVSKELPEEVVLEAIEAALVSAFKRNYSSATNVRANINPLTGDMSIYLDQEVVEEVGDPHAQITLQEAQKIDAEVEIGGVVAIDATPDNFGRIAAQTAKQVILQRLREAERDSVYQYFSEREGEIVSGTVQSFERGGGAVTVNLVRGEGILERGEQLPTERYRTNGRVRAFLMEVFRGNRGPVVRLSRSHPNMLRRLLEQEVPEIFSGTVEIKNIAREPGFRSKVAVAAMQAGVDPVGSCVGMRGTRIQNIVNELNGEKIDVVEWSQDPVIFIGHALSPAKVNDVLLEESEGGRTATVIVPDRQLSLAIGKEGQNARLAAKLTGWRIDIKSETEAVAEGLDQLARQRAHVASTQADGDLLSVAEAILREKKAATEAQFAAAQASVVQVEDFTTDAGAVQSGTGDEALPSTPAEERQPVLAEAEETVEAVEETTPQEESPEGEQPPDEAETTTEPLAESYEIPEDAEFVTAPVDDAFSVADFDAYDPGTDDSDDDEGDEGPKRKKSGKKRTLVLDEESGEMIAVRRRKPNRTRGWDVEDVDLG